MDVYINNNIYQAEEDETIIEICEKNDIYVPYLCYHPDLPPQGNCRICVVEADGKVMSACNTKVHHGMQVITESAQIDRLRKTVMELMLGNSPEDMLKEENELAIVAEKLGFKTTPFSKRQEKKQDSSSGILVFNNNKCITCGKCIQKCQIVQEVYAICYSNRGHNTEVGNYLDHEFAKGVCVFCGQCSLVCPTGAIVETDEATAVLAAIKDPTKHVVVQPAPSIRASIGETQGMPVGSKVTGKLVTAFKMLGFDKVFDTCFGADLTILEEATELVERIQNKQPLPLITSCSPGWVVFMERFYSEMLPLLSSCKSPMQMAAALIKTYYPQKNNLDPKNIVSVAIMPCVAKKFEAKRPEMNVGGLQTVDHVLTTRELGKVIRDAGIDFKNLPDTPFDSLMGISTGAGMIFAATGGVMEAALRFAADFLEKKQLRKIEYNEVRGLEGIREARIEIAGIELNVAVSHGLANAHKLLAMVKKEPKRFQFIEIMACEGGCIGGGGQPQPTTRAIIKKRTKGVFSIDKDLPLRKSQQNPEIKKVYEDFLEKPGSHKAHELLHTKYVERNRQ